MFIQIKSRTVPKTGLRICKASYPENQFCSGKDLKCCNTGRFVSSYFLIGLKNCNITDRD